MQWGASLCVSPPENLRIRKKQTERTETQSLELTTLPAHICERTDFFFLNRTTSAPAWILCWWGGAWVCEEGCLIRCVCVCFFFLLLLLPSDFSLRVCNLLFCFVFPFSFCNPLVLLWRKRRVREEKRGCSGNDSHASVFWWFAKKKRRKVKKTAVLRCGRVGIYLDDVAFEKEGERRELETKWGLRQVTYVTSFYLLLLCWEWGPGRLSACGSLSLSAHFLWGGHFLFFGETGRQISLSISLRVGQVRVLTSLNWLSLDDRMNDLYVSHSGWISQPAVSRILPILGALSVVSQGRCHRDCRSCCYCVFTRWKERGKNKSARWLIAKV